MPVEIRDLRALEGPNLYYGQPAVKLLTWSDRDIRREIGDGIKTWAQATGVVIGYLQQQLEQADDGLLILTTFTTPFPSVGKRIVEGVVADLQAAEQGDEDYSHDDVVFDVMGLRKREEPPIGLLQIFAEARARDLPFIPREDGTVMVGSGARGHVFDPAGLSLGLSIGIPWDSVGRVPVLAITGTNGKTTTVRLCAHILQAAGKRVGRTDTDGITIAGELVESGDWAGFAGARRVLSDPRVDVAVLETSRGGILRRGLGFDLCDVSVITNVSSDHLGELGVDTLEEMAQAKGVIALVTRGTGRVVLNADDPRVAALEEFIGAPIVWFTRNPRRLELLDHLAEGGDAVWSDGDSIHVAFDGTRQSFSLRDVPIVVGGAAIHNVENVMAATAACAALGVEVGAVAAALQTFLTGPVNNPGRLNLFRAGGVTAILDYAHNEAALAALLDFSRKLQFEGGGRLIVVLGGPGDRPDAQVVAQGRLVGAVADEVVVYEQERYLRGRAPGEMPALYRRGILAERPSEERVVLAPDEIHAVQHALSVAKPGDVVVVVAHARLDELLGVLETWQHAEA